VAMGKVLPRLRAGLSFRGGTFKAAKMPVSADEEAAVTQPPRFPVGHTLINMEEAESICRDCVLVCVPIPSLICSVLAVPCM
jgi:hypothetical protein